MTITLADGTLLEGAAGLRHYLSHQRKEAFLRQFSRKLLGYSLGRGVPLTRYRVRSLRPLANFDLSRTTQALGWRPAVGVREGLRRTFGRHGG